MILYTQHIDGLVQDCSISSVLAMEILQSATKLDIVEFVFSVGEFQLHACEECQMCLSFLKKIQRMIAKHLDNKMPAL